MTQRSIEERQSQQKRSAVHGVVFFVLLQVSVAICFGSLCFIPDAPGWLVVLFGGLAALALLLILSALLVLKERFKEIEGGELDVAGQY